MEPSETKNRAAHAAPQPADKLPTESKPGVSVTIEACEAWLKSHGWGASAVAHIQDGAILYVVSCNRGEEWIIGKGATQLAAWNHAVHKAA